VSSTSAFTSVVDPTSGRRTAVAGAARPMRWWRELFGLAALYAGYSLARNEFGSGMVSPAAAYENARKVMDVERTLGLFHEQVVQRWFLSFDPLIKAFNMFYGSAHFAVPVVILIALYRRRPDQYRRWRNVLILTTLAALVMFSVFPLMPPRLLADCGRYGACVASGFVDTLAQHPSPWSFRSPTVAAVSNQFAAMPSLHFGWSLWAALAVQPLLRRRTVRIAVFAYPALTLLTIVVTGNHFFLDAAIAGVLVAAAYLVQRVVERRHRASVDLRGQGDAVAGGPYRPSPPVGRSAAVLDDGAVLHHEGHSLERRDVGQRIAGHADDVGEHVRGDLSEVGMVDEIGGDRGR
jgi:PAP2 superfamily